MPSIPVFKFEVGVTAEEPPKYLESNSDRPDAQGDTNTGRWGNAEHKVFVKYLQLFGKDWRKISERIKTRSPVQVRTHAQKYFLKLRNAYTRKNKFLSEEENDVLNKFVLDKGELEAQIEANRNNASLKRKRTDDVSLSELFVRRRTGAQPCNNKLQDKLSVKIKPIDPRHFEEPDALDLLQVQAMIARDSEFDLDVFDPNVSEASDLLKPFIREPSWKYNGTDSFRKLEPSGRLEFFDPLPDDECVDLFYVL